MGTQSGSMITIATVVGFVPMMLLSPFGGVWADRMNRRYLIAGADALVALSTLGLLLAFLAGYRSYILVFIAMALRAFGGGAQNPAIGALLPQIVPEQHLGRVNGYNASIQAAVNLVAPMAAGALYAFASIEVILGIDLVTAAIGIGILLLLVRIPPHVGALQANRQSGLQDLLAGLRYIRRHQMVRRLLAYFAIVNFLFTPLALLTPLQVTRTFENDPAYLAAIEMVFAVGMFLGGLLIGSWGGLKSRITTIAIAMIVTGMLTVALGIPINFILYCTWMLLAGIMLPMINTPSITILQLSVKDQFMGRVFSVVTMIGVGAMPLAMLVFGPMSDRVPIESILIGTGIAIVTVGFALLTDRTAHRLEPRVSVTKEPLL